MRESRLNPGDVLAGRYRIRSVLGRGGAGTVYMAEDLKLPGKRWAVKELRADWSIRTDAGREAEMLIRLDHPHLPKIADYFPANEQGCAYLVMEYIRGCTLQEKFERGGLRIEVRELLAYMIQLCELLRELHERQDRPIVYRDLKPSNVMLDERGQLWLIDFGIARRTEPDRTADTMRLGTAGFAAPEQYAGGLSEPRTDLYAVGAMMYYLLSGGRTYREWRQPLTAVCPEAPAALEAIVMRLLRDDPAERHASAKALRVELELLLNPERPAPASGRALLAAAPVSILIGSLYPGAGATFVTVALAHALRSRGLPHAVVEWPGSGPDLHTLLDGDRKMPKGYRYAADLLDGAGGAAGASEAESRLWRTGSTLWHPLPPDREGQRWPAEALLRLMHQDKVPVTLVDVSDRWLDDDIRELVELADAAVVVFGPDILRLRRPSSERALNWLAELGDRGKKWAAVANHAVPWPGQKEWLRSLPLRTVCRLPGFAAEEVHTALWKGGAEWDGALGRRLLEEIRPLADFLSDALKLPEETALTPWYRKIFR